jgi:hypothetical protein
MKVALLNPPWTFEGSIYFGCRQPHLPLELGYCQSLLEAAGHEVCMLDGALDALTVAGMAQSVARFAPDLAVITTAPTYLFWRCAQPELAIPAALAEAVREHVPCLAAVGPHGSSTPGAVLNKLPVDLVVMGEAEELIRDIANGVDWNATPGIASWVGTPDVSSICRRCAGRRPGSRRTTITIIASRASLTGPARRSRRRAAAPTAAASAPSSTSAIATGGGSSRSCSTRSTG